MTEKEFAQGLIAKAPREGSYAKLHISIKRVVLMEWLAGKSDEWVNLDVKESRPKEDGTIKWYAEVNPWKPKQGPEGKYGKEAPSYATGEYKGKTTKDFVDDDLGDAPF